MNWANEPTRKTSYLLLGLIVLLGAGLRVARSRFESLTFDEQWHLQLSTGRGSVHDDLPEDVLIPNAPAVTSLRDAPPWYEIWTHMTSAVHPPLYVLTLRFWRDLFGEGDFTAQSLSILYSLGAAALLFEAGRQLFGVWPGLGAALLFAVSPNQTYIGQQIRGYALLQFLCGAAILCIIIYEQSSKPNIWQAVALGLCALLVMLTHYFGLGAMAAIGIYAVIRLRGRALAGAIAAFAIAAVIYAAIWVPFALKQQHHALGDDASWLHDDRPTAWLSTLARVPLTPWRQVISEGVGYVDQNPPILSPQYLGGVIFILPAIFLRKKPALLLPYLWLICTIGLVMGLDLARGTMQLRFTRYIMYAAPGVFLLFVGLLTLAPAWLGRAFFAAVALASIGLWQHTYKHDEPDWREIGKVLDANVKTADEPIIFYRGIIERRWFAGIYYLAASHYSQVFPRPIMKLSGPATPQVMSQIPTNTAWLISSLRHPLATEVLPGVTVLESYDLKELVTISHVRLPSHAPATSP